MINYFQTQIARENWVKASKNLNFEIISPYSVYINGIERNVFAFLPNYGSINGTIICLISPPLFETDNAIREWAEINKCHYSFINVECCLSYDEEYFKETLEDWMKY